MPEAARTSQPRGMGETRTPRPAVRVISRDTELLRWVEASAVGTGAVVQTCEEPRAVARDWRSPALLLLGADVACELAAVSPPRHPHLHLLARSETTAESLRAGLRLGARSVLDPGREMSTLAALVAAVGDPRPPGRMVALCSGSGGAGASTLAAAVALTAVRDGPTALVVSDPFGPEPALTLGSEPAPGLTWGDLEASGGRIGPAALRDALPVHGGLSVIGFGAGLAADMSTTISATTVRAVLETARAAFDTVVVDVDARSGPAWAETLARADRIWLVTRAHVAALSAARARLAASGPSVRVAVRGKGVSSAAVGRALGTHVHVRIGEERRLDEWLDLGAGPLVRSRGPIARAAHAVLDDLTGRGAA